MEGEAPKGRQWTAAMPQDSFTGLEEELARAQRERDEALEREKATAEVLRVISSSSCELGPVFQAMLESATRICTASFGGLLLYDGEAFRRVALHNAPQGWAADHQRDPFVPRSAAPALRIALSSHAPGPTLRVLLDATSRRAPL
jgi:hypothetical protein